jgi:hypothetical protein
MTQSIKESAERLLLVIPAQAGTVGARFIAPGSGSSFQRRLESSFSLSSCRKA